MNAMNQRWREGRDRYRPAGEVIDTSKYEVAAIPDDTTARAFIERHHYSGDYPSARWRFGLRRGAELAGVAVFSHPPNELTLTKVFPGEAVESVELGRFVLLDDVPGNGESWMLGRCFRELRRAGLLGVVSFSDPMPRTNAAGETVKPGHLGVIYQAHNGRYIGRSKARTLRLYADGRVLNERAIQKVRKAERGWESVVEELVAYGAEPLAGDRREWLRRALSALTRPLAHPGNHKYAWPLRPGVERFMPDGLPYPKRIG